MVRKYIFYAVFLGIIDDYVKCQAIEEGSVCEWEGLVNSIQGTCVHPRRCLTALDEQSPKHPVCSQKNGENLICCTDCKLVNETRNAIIIPSAGVFWKTGQKAHDKCLEYRRDLPYSCNLYSYGGLLRTLDVDNECHDYGLWWMNRTEISTEPRTEFPYHARLTYSDNSRCGGIIISENYILAVPQCNDFSTVNTITKVEVGIINRFEDRSHWQILDAKRLISHPEYTSTGALHHFGLVETKTPIVFNENVLPVCLQIEESNHIQAVTTSWLDPKTDNKDARKLWSFTQNKYAGYICTESYINVKAFQANRGFDEKTQLCFGDVDNVDVSCKVRNGEPLIVKNASNCVDTLIGMNSYRSLCGEDGDGINIYSKISYYLPWIERIVWP